MLVSNRRHRNLKVARGHTNRDGDKRTVNRREFECFASVLYCSISMDRAREIDSAQSVRRELGTLEAAYGKLQSETSLMFTRRSLPTNVARSTVGCG